MKTFALRTGTAGLLTLSMVLPQAGLAQSLPGGLSGLPGAADLPRVDGVLQICALEDPAPCVTLEGSVAGTEAEAEAARTDLPEGSEAIATALRDADAAAMSGAAEEAEAAEEPAAEEAEPEVAEEPAAEEEVQPEAEVAEEPAAEEEAQPEAEMAEEPAAEEAEQPEAEVAEEPAAEEEVKPEAEMAEEPAAEEEAQPEEEVAEEPAAEQPAAEAEAEAEVTAEEPAGDTEATAEASAETQPELTQEELEQIRKQLAAESEATREAAGRDAEGETVEARDDTGLTEETAEAEAQTQAEQAEETASVAAAAAAEGEGEVDAGDVETETVAEGDVRSSDEDFAKAEAGTSEKAQEAERRGLSTVEKIALLGVGALVVGELLKSGDEVVSTSQDRAVFRRPDGSTYVVKDDDALLRRPGSEVETRRFRDGSTITTVTRPNGIQVETVRDATGRVLRRTKILNDGTEVVLFDDTDTYEPVDVSRLPRHRAEEVDLSDNVELERILRRDVTYDFDRSFSLGQVRNIRAVREMVPIIDLDTITFDTGSAAIRASEADELVELGNAMRDLIEENPREVFLVEGHTDAVGSAASNLTLSDRRAESLALALTEYFEIPPENLVVQGYGESYLKVPTLEAERSNRRVAVRRITPLLTADAR